jgi:PTS system ascorbate-specific IIA component
MELLPQEYIQRIAGAGLHWQDAITLSAGPLLEQHIISQEYIDSVIQVCEEKGPYMNIGPQIVLAHARPLPSTRHAALTLLQTEAAVPLINAKHPARLWFFLATPDDISHVTILEQLAKVLMDPQQVKRLLAAGSVEELAAIFTKS